MEGGLKPDRVYIGVLLVLDGVCIVYVYVYVDVDVDVDVYVDVDVDVYVYVYICTEPLPKSGDSVRACACAEKATKGLN